MNVSQIAGGMISLALAIGTFVLSLRKRDIFSIMRISGRLKRNAKGWMKIKRANGRIIVNPVLRFCFLESYA